MGSASVLQYSLIPALVALLVVFFAVAWVLRAFRTEKEEARAGIKLLCAMRWNEFSQLISEALKDRGMQPASTDRAPGQDGFDLLFTRGKSRYLVQCMNGATQHVSAQAIGNLHHLVQMQGADGAIVAACGNADPAALKLARERRIELVAGTDLWDHVKPWVAHDQREDAEDAARAVRNKRLLISAVAALLAAILAYAVASAFAPAPALETRPAASAATRSKAPAAPPPAETGLTPAVPAAALNEEQLASRRALALLEVRGLTRIESASWLPPSTLLIKPHDALDDAELAELVKDICLAVLQYEELRYLRLQLDVPTGNPDHPVQVRWRQCR